MILPSTSFYFQINDCVRFVQYAGAKGLPAIAGITPEPELITQGRVSRETWPFFMGCPYVEVVVFQEFIF